MVALFLLPLCRPLLDQKPSIQHAFILGRSSCCWHRKRTHIHTRRRAKTSSDETPPPLFVDAKALPCSLKHLQTHMHLASVYIPPSSTSNSNIFYFSLTHAHKQTHTHILIMRVAAFFLASLASASAFIPANFKLQQSSVARKSGYVCLCVCVCVCVCMFDIYICLFPPPPQGAIFISLFIFFKDLIYLSLKIHTHTHTHTHSRVSMDISGLVGSDVEIPMFDPLGLAKGKVCVCVCVCLCVILRMYFCMRVHEYSLH